MLHLIKQRYMEYYHILNANKTLLQTQILDHLFQSCKNNLADAKLLHHPHLCIKTQVGACLQKLQDNQWQPLVYFSARQTHGQLFMDNF